ncbi:general odorant-binding protein 56a-like [Anthonomus grandis grandis]|uniref:Putative odorant-binding protein 5 n=1 Tax=Anthonomus grandis TaxID=7044 RepID=A0A2P9JZE5_ANTGR|nr:general odorant-binding protein 56a-like [Anthonomus grandis grandis]AVI04886.1 putative odorant-binding protein 5 [Anthonomus grandis]
MNNLLRVSIVLAVVSAISCQDFTEEQRKRIIENRQECIKETKVNPELIERADLGEFTEDESLKCFTKCFYQKAGFVNDKGEVQRDVIEEKLPAGADKKKALEIVDKCKAEGKNACETVYLVHKCYFEHTHPELQKQEAVTEAPKEEKKE